MFSLDTEGTSHPGVGGKPRSLFSAPHRMANGRFNAPPVRMGASEWKGHKPTGGANRGQYPICPTYPHYMGPRSPGTIHHSTQLNKEQMEAEDPVEDREEPWLWVECRTGVLPLSSSH